MHWSLSGPAREDLDIIWSHIANDNIAAADKLLLRLVDRFEMLSRQPLIGEACPELQAELRCFPLRPYIVYYTVESGSVSIVRVLHGARDVRQHFNT